jgi:hypothetical protein
MNDTLLLAGDGAATTASGIISGDADASELRGGDDTTSVFEDGLAEASPSWTRAPESSTPSDMTNK